MVKTYLKYALSHITGLTNGSKTQCVGLKNSNKIFFTSCNNYILIFDTKKGSLLQMYKSNDITSKDAEVSCIESSNDYLFVGYSTGDILILKINIKEYDKIISRSNFYLNNSSNNEQPELLSYYSKFSLHKSSITSLEYNNVKNQLLSGSSDTSIILWDISSESVLLKLSGHKDSIIKTNFYVLRNNKTNINLEADEDNLNIVVSSSKDDCIKIWNLKNQECIQTIANLTSKINYFTIIDRLDMLVVGTYSNKLILYKLQYPVKKQNNKLDLSLNNTDYNLNSENTVAHIKGSLIRQTGSKVNNIILDCDNKLLIIISKDNNVEFFKVLSNNELLYRIINTEETKNNNNNNNNSDSSTVNKDKIIKSIENEEYNFSLRFLSLFKFYKEEVDIVSIYISSTETIGINEDNDNNNNINNNKIKKGNKIKNSSNNVKQYTKLNFCVGLKNNTIEVYEIITNYINDSLFKSESNSNALSFKLNILENNIKLKKKFTIELGHREIVRWVKFSKSNTRFLTGSYDSVKLWNYSNKSEKLTEGYIDFYDSNKHLKILSPQTAIKSISIEDENIICASFISNDEFIVIGTKKGSIYMYETDSCELVAEVQKAHQQEIWNIVEFKLKGIIYVVTCSSDKNIHYFKLNTNVVNDNNQTNMDIEDNINSILSLERTITTPDHITFFMFSPNKKYITYSLLDSTIRIAFQDSGKQFLSLYGHNLPVINYDISSDSSLLVSGSGDKNLRIWGMDFGDCHRFIFGHSASITCVKFVNKTHYFFSCSRDNSIKYWDADKFVLITEHKDFLLDVWYLDINQLGSTLVAVSADKSIKIYELTKEQTVLSIENENQIDEQIEEELEKELNKNVNSGNNKSTAINTLNPNIVAQLPLKKNIQNLTYAEQICNSIDICEKFKEEVFQYEIAIKEYNNSIKLLNNNQNHEVKFYNITDEKPTKPELPIEILYMPSKNKNIFEYITYQIRKVQPLTELENTLNNLSYYYIQKLMYYLEYMIRNRIELELASRCVNFIIILYEVQFSNDKTLVKIIESIRIHLKFNLEDIKNIVNFNIHSINCVESIINKRKEDNDFLNNNNNLDNDLEL